HSAPRGSAHPRTRWAGFRLVLRHGCSSNYWPEGSSARATEMSESAHRQVVDRPEDRVPIIAQRSFGSGPAHPRANSLYVAHKHRVGTSTSGTIVPKRLALRD